MHLQDVVNAFEDERNSMDSSHLDLSSNDALGVVSVPLEKLGYRVEKPGSSIQVPVLYGENGHPSKYYAVDALNLSERTVIEVEAGTGVANNGYLKDLFQACLLPDVDYLVVAVRQVYGKSKNYNTVCTAFETMYTSTRLVLPLKGILVIGY